MKTLRRSIAGALLTAALVFPFGQVLAENLVTNPGMEESYHTSTLANGWWDGVTGGYWGSARRTDWQAHSGNYAMTLPGIWNTSADEGGIWQRIAIESNLVYRLGSSFMIDNGWTAANTSCKLEWQRADFSVISEAVFSLQDLAQDVWTEKEWMLKAPLEAEYACIVLGCSGANSNGTFYIDDVSLAVLEDDFSVLSPSYLPAATLDCDQQTNSILELRNTCAMTVPYAIEIDTAAFVDAIPLPDFKSDIVHTCITDMNNNGTPDLPMRFTNSAEIVWWEFTAGAWNSWTSSISSNTASYSYAAGDVDGDGDPDLISTQSNMTEMCWWENTTGTGDQFVQHTIGLAFNGSKAFGDLDNDGDTDVVYYLLESGSHGSYSYSVHCHENMDGNGLTWQSRELFECDNITGLKLADLDGDGDLDIVINSTFAYGSPEISFQLYTFMNNESDGQPWTHTRREIATTTTGESYFPVSVTTADLDGSGSAAILVQREYLVIWTRTIGGSWTQHVASSIFPNDCMVAGDLDGDRDSDLITENFWWENNGGTPSEWMCHALPYASNSTVVIVDLDDDSDFDILTDSFWLNNIHASSDWSWFQVTPASGQLNAGEQISLSVQFDAAGLVSNFVDRCSLKVYVNGNKSPSYQLLAQLVVGSGVPEDDDDNDGLANQWEEANGLNRLVPDAFKDLDRDGLSNISEFRAGTSASDPASTVQICEIIEEGQDSRFICESGTNATRYLMYSPSLQSPEWSCIHTNTDASTTSAEFVVPNGPSGYYRLRVSHP